MAGNSRISTNQPERGVAPFVESVLAGDDEATEECCQHLTADDTEALVAIAEAPDSSRIIEIIQSIAPGTTDLSPADPTQANALWGDCRWWAIRALAICGETSCITNLITLFNDPNPEVRAVAVLSAGHIGKRDIEEHSIEKHSVEKSRITQADDVDQASKASGPDEVDASAMRAMAALFDDANGTVRQSAADALILYSDLAVPVLQSVLASDSEAARVRAAYALRKIATQGGAIKATAPALFQILNDSNYLVHTYAHEALEEMGLLDNVLVVV